VGYFSDNAIAKLLEVAETLFGTTRAKEKHKEVSATESVSTEPATETSTDAATSLTTTTTVRADTDELG